MLTPFVLHYADAYAAFRVSELLSLAEVENVELQDADIREWEAAPADATFFIVHLANRDAAARLTRRSILLRSVFELWAEGTSYEELHGNLKAKLAADPSLLEPYMESRFRFQISAFGASLTLQEQRERVESFSFMACRGPIDLKTPEVIYVLAEDYGRDPKRSSPPETFRRAYFGLLIGSGNRDARTKFDLKKRAYLGTTSMDAELSLIMSNTAKVTPGSVVLDPFVGTGSMLVTAAHFGGLVVGCDIDGRQIRGGRIGIPFKHTAGKDIRDNVQQYNCQKQLIDTPVCDISHHPWRPVGFFDAIITDPPYGVRAGAKKIGKPANYQRVPSNRPVENPRYPATVPYEIDEVVADLVDFAAVHLQTGGRLSFWMPVHEDGYGPQDIEPQSCMVFKFASEQRFGNWSRWLVTFEKVSEPVEGERTTLRNNGNKTNFRDLYFNKGLADADNNVDEDR